MPDDPGDLGSYTAAELAAAIEHEGDEEGCRTRKIVERAVDGSLHIRKVQRCA